MSLDWTRHIVQPVEDGARFAEWRAHDPHTDSRATVYQFHIDGARLWSWSVMVRNVKVSRISTDAPACKTADEAKRAAESAYWAKRAEESAAEAASNYSAARRAGNEAGRAHFAGVQAGTMARPESLSEFARLSSAANCGSFAAASKRAAYESAYRAGYRDAEFMAGRDAEMRRLDARNARAVRRGRIENTESATLGIWLRGLRVHRAMYSGALRGSALSALFDIAAIRAEMRRRAASNKESR